jgi:hypothetical protein
MIKTLWLTVLAGILPVAVFCQNPSASLEVVKMQWTAKEVIQPSPEAAALGQYGNVPVSLFTGTPTISIPMYELKGNSLSLPISLSYNASGFKPEDEATWCGSAWSLFAGGVITRAVRGNPDEYGTYFGTTDPLNYPSSSNFFDQDTYLQNISDGYIETQPDIYYYNFAGHSGKFLLKYDGTSFKKEKDLKSITFGSGFTIVDEQGITYVFDVDEVSEMRPTDDFGQPSSTIYIYPSAWYLRSMTSAAGDEVIEFEYHTNISGSIQNGNRLNNRSVSYTYGVKAPNNACMLSVNETPTSALPPPEVLIHRKFLKKIIFKKSNVITAYIDVLSATGQRQDTEDTYARRLNQVKVYSTNSTTDKLIKQYDFTYGYFVNLANNFNKRRLRLESLQEISVDSVTPSPPAYSFTYNTAEPIPERFTASLDHWGFYNASGNTSLVPNFNFTAQTIDNMFFPARTVGDGANREASFSGSSATMLNKITYPTGGYTTFEYELNEVKDGFTVRPVGGLRVKQITDYSFNGQAARAKVYSYLLDDGSPSGAVGIFPVYESASSYHHYNIPFQNGPCETLQEYREHYLYTLTVSANSIFGLGSFQGSHIGYTQVIESQIDLGNSQTLGKTVYNYSFYGSFAADDYIGNGDLVNQRVYRNDGKLLQEITNTYNTTNGDVLNSVMIKATSVQSNKKWHCKTAANMYYNYGDWESAPPGCVVFRNIPTARYPETSSFTQQNKRLTQTVTKIYDENTNDYLVTTRDLFYDNAAHNYPTRIEETTTNSAKVKTAIKYVVDYAAAPAATAGSIAYNINAMQQKNIMSLPVEKLQYRQDAGGGNTRYISGQITDHIIGKPSKIYFLETYPLATSVTTSSISSNIFNYDSRYRLAGTMEYANENLVEQYKTNDISKTYIWDYNNLYPVAEVTGASDNEVWYTSFETTSKGGFTFTGNGVADATSPTGAKCYNLTGNTISATVDNTKSYIVSYWRKNAAGSSFTVSGSAGLRQGVTQNGWTHFEHTVSGTATVNISGSGYIDELRLYLSGALMVTRTYDPLIGVTSASDVNNQITYYNYDGLLRLVNIKDGDGNIVKNFKYNYGLGTAPNTSSQSLYYNAATQGTYTKAGCTLPQYGTQVVYKVPYGKYAALSQIEANNLAAADLATNGQNLANLTGQCFWKNAAASQLFYSQNCPPEQGPPVGVNYTVSFGKYTSLISQADANAQAAAEITAQGQTWANGINACECVALNLKYINGVCEPGENVPSGGSWENGMWKCFYFYRWSDGSTSPFYYDYSTEPCPIAP